MKKKLKTAKKKIPGRKPRPILDRLFDKTRVPRQSNGEPDKKQCWFWHGNTNNHGYGLMKVSAELNMATVHRISYIEHTHKINYGDKVMVLHTCGNKLCVNPHHLKEGQHQDKVALQRKFKAWNPMFKNKEFMWPVCEHCGETTYMPHFKRLHAQCEQNAKHKYKLEQHQHLEKK